jgi:hypothetical protein
MSAPVQPAPLPTGRISGEPIGVYHGRDTVSVSKLKVFRYSPELYHGRFISKTIPPPKETQAFKEGKAIESLALDGRDAHMAAYYSVPEGVGKVRVGDKAIRESLAAQHPGKIALSHDEWEMCERINENVHKHALAGPLLAACEKQVTFRIQGAIFYLQVRPDGIAEEGCALTDGQPVIVDMKSIPALPDDDPDVIPRQISDFWYHGQAFVYREVVATVLRFKPEFRPRFVFVWVEKEAPHRVKVTEIDDLALDLAAKQVSETTLRLKSCHESGVWPATWDDTWQKTVPKVGLPAWYLRREVEAKESNLWG